MPLYACHSSEKLKLGSCHSRKSFHQFNVFRLVQIAVVTPVRHQPDHKLRIA